MPSSITHELIAEEALKRSPTAAKWAQEAPDYYYLGAQGPDLFFFYRPLSGDMNLGQFLHRKKTYVLFRTFLSALKKLNDFDRVRAQAYVLGYISHYSADIAFHPFVYCYLRENDPPRFTHQQIENDWDVYFLRTRRSQEAEHYPFPFSAKLIAREGALAALWKLVLDDMGWKFSTSALRRALFLFQKYLKFFHGNCYKRNEGWEKAERILHIRGGVSKLFPRREPSEEYLGGEEFYARSEEKAEHAEQLFDYAANDSARLMEEFIEAFRRRNALPRAEFSRHLLTGKMIK